MRDIGARNIKYWLYSPGNDACMWEEFFKEKIMGIRWGIIGNLEDYDSKEEIKQSLRENLNSDSTFMNIGHELWQFANVMQEGDIIFVKKGFNQIIGRGVVSSEYYYDSERKDEFKHLRKVRWTNKGSWKNPVDTDINSLMDISSYTDDIKKIRSLFSNLDEIERESEEFYYSNYTREDFLNEVFVTSEDYEDMKDILKLKKNLILQGPPGVGKTFIAKRLAYSLMGEKDTSRVRMVQFHKRYSYEDFMMGFRPGESGYTLRTGPFYKFCKTAEIDSENDYYFIIDEINRGEIENIFGELFMLLDSDKRGEQINLLYQDEKFSVPENIYIIGTLNTADRNPEMYDYALRRRFIFFDLKSNIDSEGFRKYQRELSDSRFDRLVSAVKKINTMIMEDENLGWKFCIGHSYLFRENMNERMMEIIAKYEIMPLLEEYWFYNLEKLDRCRKMLFEAIQ